MESCKGKFCNVDFDSSADRRVSEFYFEPGGSLFSTGFASVPPEAFVNGARRHWPMGHVSEQGEDDFEKARHRREKLEHLRAAEREQKRFLDMVTV